MAAPIVYRSSDASAPTLNGTVGSLVGVLDACLVNGYGSQAAAGWTKAFAGTNKGDYRMAAGNQFYLDVDDSGPGGAGAKEAVMRGYESMSALATGSNAFPTTGQQTSPNPSLRKSATADATARAWLVAADDRTFYFFASTADRAGYYYGFSFGDFYSYISADPGRTCCMARPFNNGTNDAFNACGQGEWNNNWFYVARKANGTAGTSDQYTLNYCYPGTSPNVTLSCPDPNSGNIWLSRCAIASSNDSQNHAVRGYMRGWYYIHCETNPAPNDGDTFTGTGSLAGRSFLVVRDVHADTNSNGGNQFNRLFALETTAWDTSS